MDIIDVDLNLIKKKKDYNVFEEIKFKDIDSYKKRYPYVIDILINRDNELIFDYSILDYYKSNGIKRVKAIRSDFSYSNNLFLYYNFRDKFFYVNDFDKLMFLSKVLNEVDLKEIYSNVNLNLKLNKELINNIEKIIKSCCKQGLINGFVTIESCKRMIDFSKENRESLMELFNKIKFSYSNQLKAIDFFEEISFRDKVSFNEIINKIDIENIKEKDNSQNVFMEELFKLRYPLYSKSEEKWESFLKTLKLPENFSINHYPFFEKKDINLDIKFKTTEEFIEFIKKIQ